MNEPFLFRFKKRCQSPSRNSMENSYIYDQNTDMVIDRNASTYLLAIESERSPGPMTKKKDIEKGEDAKDRRMWQ